MPDTSAERLRRLRLIARSSVVGGDVQWLLDQYDKLTNTTELVPVGGDSDKFVCPMCDGEGKIFGDT